MHIAHITSTLRGHDLIKKLRCTVPNRFLVHNDLFGQICNRQSSFSNHYCNHSHSVFNWVYAEKSIRNIRTDPEFPSQCQRNSVQQTPFPKENILNGSLQLDLNSLCARSLCGSSESHQIDRRRPHRYNGGKRHRPDWIALYWSPSHVRLLFYWKKRKPISFNKQRLITQLPHQVLTTQLLFEGVDLVPISHWMLCQH